MHICNICEKCKESIKPMGEASNPPENPVSNMPQSIDDDEIKFFRRPSTTSPFEFDYEKIFATNDDEGVVKNSINAALDMNKHLTRDSAIAACLKDMWQLELKRWNEAQQAKKGKIIADCDAIRKNKRKILSLLKKGIQLMQKNPKFVLASLPEAHRLPILKEWMLKRFGIIHDTKHNEKRWRLNVNQQKRLKVAGMVPKIPVPTMQEVTGHGTSNIPIDKAAKLKSKVGKISST
jgi:hypothetical protein